MGVIILTLLLQLKKMIASMMLFFGHLNIIAIIAINRFLISRFLKCVNMKMLKKTHFQENHFARLDPKEALDDFFQIKVHFMLILNLFNKCFKFRYRMVYKNLLNFWSS